MRGRKRQKVRVRENSKDASMLVLKTEEGLQAKECWWLPEAGRSKKMDSPWEPPEGMRSCQHLDFSPVRPVSDFSIPEL